MAIWCAPSIVRPHSPAVRDGPAVWPKVIGVYTAIRTVRKVHRLIIIGPRHAIRYRHGLQHTMQAAIGIKSKEDALRLRLGVRPVLGSGDQYRA